jgi:hypothetical protein
MKKSKGITAVSLVLLAVAIVCLFTFVFTQSDNIILIIIATGCAGISVLLLENKKNKK